MSEQDTDAESPEGDPGDGAARADVDTGDGAGAEGADADPAAGADGDPAGADLASELAEDGTELPWLVDPTAERVADADPEAVARGIEALRSRIAALEDELSDRDAEIEDLESRLKRKQAEFQNYKKRQKRRLEEEKERATEELVGRLLDVRDNLERALDQEEGADIRGGVETTLAQFDEQLDREGVERIEPEPGADLDPQRHEALATVPAGEPEGTVADLHRPGYEMGGKVIRPAQVAVSDGSGTD